MYKLTKENKSVIRKADNACIPFAEGNRDYAEYLEWLAEGGVPESAQTVDEVRQEALAKLNSEKRKIKTEGVTVEGVKFDTDEESRIAYLELMIKFMINPEYTVNDWKASDGVWVTMNKSMFDKLVTAWEARLTSLFSFVKVKETEIKNKVDKESISNTNVTYSGI